MATPEERRLALLDALESRILIIDGAMGTMLHKQQLTAADGPAQDGCVEYLLKSRPEAVLEVHREYFKAGADIIETNSFGGTRIVLAEFGLENLVETINMTAARLARQAADEFSTPSRPRWVAGSMGPTTKAITVTGGVTFRQLETNYYEQAKALIDGGADILVLETCQDTRNVKAGVLGVQRLMRELGRRIPLMISGTIEAMGTMLAGQTADALWSSIAHVDLLSVGLNCATGPEFMTDHMRTLSEIASTRISCYPNAGLPNEEGKYLETPESLAESARALRRQRLAESGGRLLRHHRRAHTRHRADGRGTQPARGSGASRRAFYSGIELVEAEDSIRPLIVGERTNVIGSRAFKKLIAEEQWEQATEIARQQVKNGAHIVDVCLQSTDREEIKDIPLFYEKLIRLVKAPIMIDTTDPAAIELALTYCQGKSIINSINLEDGEEKFERVCPLARRLWRGADRGHHRRRQTAGAGFHARAQAGGGGALRSSCSRKNTAFRRRTSSSIRWCFPAPPATPTTLAGRWRPSKRSG